MILLMEMGTNLERIFNDRQRLDIKPSRDASPGTIIIKGMLHRSAIYLILRLGLRHPPLIGKHKYSLDTEGRFKWSSLVGQG